MIRINHLSRSSARGFTLLELLVVLMIIAVLASYVGPKVFGEIDKAKQKAASAQMKTLAGALGQYRLDVGQYPDEAQGLSALTTPPTGVSGWRGPYLEREVPADPWGTVYRWRNPARNAEGGTEVEIVSLGADRRTGGAGVDADLVYAF